MVKSSTHWLATQKVRSSNPAIYILLLSSQQTLFSADDWVVLSNICNGRFTSVLEDFIQH